MQGADAGQGNQCAASVKHGQRVDAGQQQVKGSERDKRRKGDAPQAEAGAQPAGKLHGHYRADGVEGHCRLNVTAAPTKGFLQRQHHGAEGVHDRHAGRGGQTH
ncbi:hypothetical protein D9M70_523910 [compost metagenome]